MTRSYICGSVKEAVAIKQHGQCPDCGLVITGSCELDHWLELADGGSNDPENLVWRHASPCHKSKSIRNHKARAKAKRIRRKAEGTWKPNRRRMQSRPFPKDLRKRMDGTVMRRT